MFNGNAVRHEKSLEIVKVENGQSVNLLKFMFTLQMYSFRSNRITDSKNIQMKLLLH